MLLLVKANVESGQASGMAVLARNSGCKLSGSTHRFCRRPEKIGLWSYSIYLTHMLVMVGAKQILLRLGLGVIPILVARLGLSVVFGAIFYKLVEHPFIEKARGGKKKKKADAPVPASAGA